MTHRYEAQLDNWHSFIESEGQQVELLDEILAEGVVFRSPVVWTPQLGKALCRKYLVAAAQVLKDFKYIRELSGDNSVGLEFSARVGDITIIGIDLIEFNEADLIKDFEVMVRPAKGMQALAEAMKNQLASNSPA